MSARLGGPTQASISEDALATAAEVIKCLGHPLRLRLLEAERNLREERMRVAALRRELPVDTVVEDYVVDEGPAELSGGMQQRASIVRALSYDPNVLLMDEPFGSLDAYTRDEMDTLLLEIWKKTKKTIAFVTHRIEEAVYLANRVYVMTPRPGSNSAEFDIDLPRPRPEGITTTKKYFDIVTEIKKKIVSDVKKQKEEGVYKSQAFSTVT